jgi:N-acetylglutamate synthase-like GNAT family acetyltransferase
MKRYIYGIGPCYVLTSGEHYIKKHGWELIEQPKWHPDKVVRISKQSKANLIK